MQLAQNSTDRTLRRITAVALAGLLTLAATADPPQGNRDPHRGVGTRMTINAGTAFRFDPNTGHHEVRGIAQVSNLGNSKVFFDVNVIPCPSGSAHFLCVAGTMTITTLANDKLHTAVVGWLDFDPNDPKTPPTMGTFHYDVTVTGGTGGLAGALGHGEINGAAMFVGPDGPDDTDPTDDGFCDGYHGVATWLYDGMLFLPPPQP